MKLIDYIKSLFNSPTVITTADGQKAITLEGITPEIDGGLELFEIPVDGDKKEPDQISDVDMLYEKLGEIMDRLEVLEKAIVIVENEQPAETYEVW